MNATLSSRWCVATVTSAAYAAGTRVLLSSFLRHNPWFTGTLAVIHDPGEPLPGVLRRLPNVQSRPASDELTRLLASTTYTSIKAPRFHSLEAFRLREFERVLYLDADIVCTGDLRELFEMEGPLLCCPDQAYFWGHSRHRATYASEDAGRAAPDTVFTRTFNTGVMMLTTARLDDATFTQLLARIETRDWNAVSTGHSVSVVLNDHFEHAWTAVSERYNYLIGPGTQHYRRVRVPVTDAVFLHFIGQPKPWEPASRDAIVNEDHARALEAWHAAAAT